MFWILAAPSLLALLLAVPLLPYRSVRTALRQAHAADGGWGGLHLRREGKRLGSLLRRTVLRPLLLLAVVQLVLALHHVSLGPAHLLAEVFGDFHPETSLNAVDLDAWREAYAEAQRERPASPPLLRQLVARWPLYPSYLALAVVYLATHFLHRFPRAVQGYARGVQRRGLRLQALLR
jgi:hypothetical protein